MEISTSKFYRKKLLMVTSSREPIIAFSIMLLNVFLQVKKIYKNIIISFFANTNLDYYQVRFFFNVFSLEFEKIITRTYCINYLDFFNHKTLPKPLICICGQSNSFHAKLFLTAITVYHILTNNLY